MNETRKTVFVAFSSQKGGVGKSAFTTLLASLMHYRLDYNVAVFDADFPQHSLVKMKNRDLVTVMQNETLKKIAYRQFSATQKKAYPILPCKADTVLQAANDFIKSSLVPLDIIFFDLPGTVNTPGILKALAGMHHIFTPITADRVVMESTLVFTQVLKDVIMKKGETAIKTVNLFWNQVDGRENTPLYRVYDQLIHELDLKRMYTRIKSSARFRKESEINSTEIFRSTLMPPDQRLMKSCHLDLFVQEFLKIIEL
ncbi:conjugal transfer protein TraA [Elizabethkingia anophelis]|nr:conjugal transfer protein TraA [Elizabethkingia anophelis]MDV3860877.1 conjugal transfer protein TraA [Elizabethkingia anophelis]MDV3909325.1 conjugal transfer protein TraA [Elizabethkingia anophelis]MDV3922783.1 conjugal transfer protein TraA [Elizabethkingia anophelis]MDV3989081.1 conjugal transfer protein TraA [Elizabethkingia anophelis]